MPGRPGSSASLQGANGGDQGSGGGGSGGGKDEKMLEAIAAGNVMLEVTAYPAGLFSPPQQEEQEQQQQQQQHAHLRSVGRRRVVLTVEGLWQRRRLMHPDVNLPDKLPVGAHSWLERDSGCGSTLAAREEQGEQEEAPNQAEGDEDMADGGAGEGGLGRGSERPEGDGSEAGNTDERRTKKRAQQEALDDLVDMVAFGPIANGKGRRQGACFEYAVALLDRTRRRSCRSPPLATTATAVLSCITYFLRY